MANRVGVANQDGMKANRLLASLPAREYQRLAKWLEPISYRSGDWLDSQGKARQYVYFPQSGMLSLLRPMNDGTVVEVGTVGNEGVTGVGLFLDAVNGHVRLLCQVPSEIFRVEADAFHEVLEGAASLQSVLERYGRWLTIHFMQQIACNRLHSVEQRCAAWLLMTHDRVPGDAFELKQEFLALMLGVRRASVTVVANAFQDAGLIRYSRGHLEVISRGGLKRVSCECYDVIKGAYRDIVQEI